MPSEKSSPSPSSSSWNSQLLFHSHIQSTYIQFILLPTLIICNPDHSNRLGLTASILALANPFSTQQPAMLKQNRSCCSHKILQSLPTTFIVKSYTSLLIELWTYQCLASLPSHMFFWPGMLSCPSINLAFRVQLQCHTSWKRPPQFLLKLGPIIFSPESYMYFPCIALGRKVC